MDELTRLIENNVGHKKYETYQVNGTISITHLMHVDDILYVHQGKPKINWVYHGHLRGQH